MPNEVKYYEVSNAEQIQACDGSGKLVARSNGGNNIEELYGAGGWVASPAELLRFLAVIDKDPGIPDLLSDASIDYMTQEVPSAYPIGWIETTSRGEWFRSGTLAGTSALMKKQKRRLFVGIPDQHQQLEGLAFPSLHRQCGKTSYGFCPFMARTRFV